MVDFTWHIGQQCGSIRQRTTHKVPSSSINTLYTVNVKQGVADCSCPGFKYHGKCKHAAAVEAKCCGWALSTGDVAQTLQQNSDMVCPGCGGPTELVKEAA